MHLELTKPDLERFISEQVEAGHFPTAEAAIEAAIAQMMVDYETDELTDEDVEDILESEAQIDNGQCVDFDVFASKMRKKYFKQ